MILQIFSNPDWVFIINFVGISLGLISLYKSYKYPFEKDFNLIEGKNSTINSVKSESFGNKTHKIELLFENFGKSTTILRKDWAQKLKIEFLSKVKIQHIDAFTNEKYSKIEVKIQDSHVMLDCDFIEPKKYLRVIIYYLSSERVLVNLSGKIIGGNEIRKQVAKEEDIWTNYYYGKKIADADFFHFPLITIMFFLVFSYCFLGMFNIEYRNVIPKIIVFNKESFLLLILLIIISGISVLIGLKLKRAFVPMSKLAKEEKTWFRKVSMSG